MAPGQQNKRTRSDGSGSEPEANEVTEAMEKLLETKFQEFGKKFEEMKTDLLGLFSPAMQKVNSRVLRIERDQRSKNIIIKGVKSKDNEKILDLEKAVEGVFAKLGLRKIDIDDVMRLGKRDKADRPILVKLVRQKDVRAILTEKRKLGKEKIYIERDLPDEDRLAAFELRKKFKEMKAKDGDLTSSIRNQTMIVWKNNTQVGRFVYKEKEKSVENA